MAVSVPRDLSPWPAEPIALNSIEVTIDRTIFRECEEGQGFAIEVKGTSRGLAEVWRTYALPSNAVFRDTLALRALDLARAFEVQRALADLNSGEVQWNELRVRRADLLLYPDLIEWKASIDAQRATKSNFSRRTSGGKRGRPKGWRAPGPLMELAGLALAVWLRSNERGEKITQRAAILAVDRRFASMKLLPVNDQDQANAIDTVTTYMKRLRARLKTLEDMPY